MIRYFGVNTATAQPSFQPCVVEEPTSLEQWIKPPSNLLRKMTDKELLWRASFTSRQIPSQLSEWGKMSMCNAERTLLANALLDICNEWFVLLSESCIPLYNFSVIYHYIKKSKYGFIGAFDDPGPYGRGRYNQNMAPEVNVMMWRKGSQWFEINRKLAVYIVEDMTFYPKFDEFCKLACYVDEHYFLTMLTMQASNLLANRSITWVDW